MKTKFNTTSQILSQTPSNEGKVLIGNFSRKVIPFPSSSSDYMVLLQNAKRSIYARFFPMIKMTPSENLAFENRLEKLIDIIAESYDEDVVEDSKEEANYIQKALIHSERY